MAPTFVLLVVFWTSSGLSSHTIPMASRDVCERESVKIEAQLSNVTTICLQTN